MSTADPKAAGAAETAHSVADGSSHLPREGESEQRGFTFSNVASIFMKGSEGEEDDDDEEEEEEEEEDEGWISWFCSLDGHDCFAEVDEEFIRDAFNLFGLKSAVNNFDGALDMILGDAPDEEEVIEQSFVDVYRDAVDLYGLIHARFIISPRGLPQMRDRCIDEVFGHCPRVLCDRQVLLPVGISPDLRLYRLRLFCPLCKEVYEMVNGHEVTKDIDGAYFGPSFPHIFLQTYSNMIPTAAPIPYQPRLFGFRIHNRHSIIKIKLENGEYGSDYIPPNRQPSVLAVENKQEDKEKD